MKIKPGVTLNGLDLSMRMVLMVADEIWKSFGQELVVTSALDGTHSASSLHYYGYALDFRTRYFTEPQKWEVFELLSSSLPKSFVVYMHDTHIHVENRSIINGSN